MGVATVIIQRNNIYVEQGGIKMLHISDFMVGYFTGMVVTLIVIVIVEYIHKRINKEE